MGGYGWVCHHLYQYREYLKWIYKIIDFRNYDIHHNYATVDAAVYTQGGSFKSLIQEMMCPRLVASLSSDAIVPCYQRDSHVDIDTDGTMWLVSDAILSVTWPFLSIVAAARATVRAFPPR